MRNDGELPESEINDDDLMSMVALADRELFYAGLEIRQRDFEVPRLVMERLGHIQYALYGAGVPAVLKRIRGAFYSMYRPQDVAIGGHVGVFMYRDIFARIGVHRSCGTIRFDPFECVELTPMQMIIIQSEPEQVAIYLDQFIDVSDVQFGTERLKAQVAAIDLAERFIGLARLQLHAAAAVLTGGYDHRGAAQAALLAVELALKAALAATGLSEQKIKSAIGHHVLMAVDLIASKFEKFDAARVKRVIATHPSYVENRYSAAQPGRIEVGNLVMGSQYIVSEVVRQLSDEDARSTIRPLCVRFYPQ